MMDETKPSIGIFWQFEKKLLFDCTPLDQAEKYGDCLTHPRGHIDCWTEMQRRFQVPRDVEYEEPPRGRVLYDERRDRFALLADRCILRHADLVARIVRRMCLPTSKLEISTDPHYKCLRAELNAKVRNVEYALTCTCRSSMSRFGR